MNMKKENKSEIKQKKVFARCLAALLALCVVSTMYGNETIVSDNRSGEMSATTDAASIGISDVYGFTELAHTVLYHLGVEENAVRQIVSQMINEADDLAAQAVNMRKLSKLVSDDLYKKSLEIGARYCKVQQLWEGLVKHGEMIGLGLGTATILADGVIKVMQAASEEDRIYETTQLLARLSSHFLVQSIMATAVVTAALAGTSAATLIAVAVVTFVAGALLEKGFEKLVGYYNQHPEKNGFAIMINWFYDHSSIPEKISEWWYDVRYGDAILQDRYDRQIDYGQKYEFIPPDELANYDDGNQEDPFDTLPESNRGCFDGNTSESRYQGLKALRLID